MDFYDNIPQELRSLNRWVCANRESKEPMDATFPVRASVSAPTTWNSFDTAVKAVQNKMYSDIGFVFSNDGYEDGLLSELAADIIGECKSYTEKSRSGRGFHILVRGDIPFRGKNNRAGVEIYKSGRYFILTGRTLLFKEIEENQIAINRVLEKYFRQTEAPAKERKPRAKTKEVSTEERERPLLNIARAYRTYGPNWDGAVKGARIRLRPEYPRIGEGCRNTCLTSLAGILHNQGYTHGQIYGELSHANKTACDPPLSAGEVMAITNSVTRYRR